jgi:hypothetical protein
MYMLDTDDSEIIADDLDPDDLDPAIEDLEALEEDEDDDNLDDFGEPPVPGSVDDEQFGRLRH